MATTYCNTDHDSVFPRTPADMSLPEVFVTRPMVKIPRSAKQEYSDSELSTAAAMLAKMRNQKDVIERLREHPDPVVFNGDHTLDAAVDKLLNTLR